MSLWIDQKYIGLVGSRLARFKKKSANLYNFRCPFCGDSQTDPKKARGFFYVYKSRFQYKCHNCNLSTNLYRVIEHLDPQLAKAYALENFQESGNTSPAVEEVKEYVKLPKSVLAPIGAVPASENALALAYLKDRKIPEVRWKELYFLNDISQLAKINSDYKDRLLPEARILIPFTDWKGNITGVTCRALGQSKKRYIGVRFSNYPLIYGLEHINKSERAYLLEGAFDSMFVPNALAAGGSDMQRAAHMFTKDQLVIIYDNEPRNKEIVGAMERLINLGYSAVIWPEAWNHKDINQAIISGVDNRALMEVIYKNTFSDLALQYKFREWKRV